MSEEETDRGATVVITHRVPAQNHAEYEIWLREITSACQAAAGHLDWQVIRPLAGLTETYTFIIRFDTRTHLQAWMESQTRARLIEKVQPLLSTRDDFYIRSGLDFWFAPEGAKAKLPVRWKQFLLTWSAIFPLVLAAGAALAPVLNPLGIALGSALYTLAATGIVVFLMVYVVMPRYTKLVQRWLFS